MAERLQHYQAPNIVLDPVMIVSSGAKLIADQAVEALRTHLFPLACLLTPNIAEAEVLSDQVIETAEDMEQVARQIGDRFHVAILLKGGHRTQDANDLLYADGKLTWFSGQRVDNPNNHGTGCTLSSAIASQLAQGKTLEKAIATAKAYVTLALEDQLDLG